MSFLRYYSVGYAVPFFGPIGVEELREASMQVIGEGDFVSSWRVSRSVLPSQEYTICTAVQKTIGNLPTYLIPPSQDMRYQWAYRQSIDLDLGDGKPMSWIVEAMSLTLREYQRRIVRAMEAGKNVWKEQFADRLRGDLMYDTGSVNAWGAADLRRLK